MRLVLCSLLLATTAMAQTPVLVDDLRPDANQNDPSAPERFVAGDTQFFFTAETAEYGRELWRSDGTAAGTRLVRDIWPGSVSSYIGYGEPAPDMAVIGDVAYFRANDGVFGYEPWRSDGTPEGTYMLLDTAPGGRSSSHRSFYRLGNRILFVDDSYDPSGMGTLWASDGTAAGTQVIATYPVSDDLTGQFFNLGDRACFDAPDMAANQSRLYCTDGTTSGTEMVGAFLRFSLLAGEFEVIGTVGGKLYFAHFGNIGSTDGTAAGTDADVDLGVSYSATCGTLPGGRLVFSGSSVIDGTGIYATDGTAAGTSFVAAAYMANCVALDGGLYAFSFDGELWFTDGTSAGTERRFQIQEVDPTATTTPFRLDLSAQAGRLYLRFASSDFGQELWVSNGTLPGTQLLRDIAPLAASSRFIRSDEKPLGFGGHIYFAADDLQHGRELWRTDGTPAGTTLFLDLEPRSGSRPSHLTAHDSGLYFVADDGETGRELWHSNGTAAATTPLTTFVAQQAPTSDDCLTSGVEPLAVSPPNLYFGFAPPRIANCTTVEGELWSLQPDTSVSNQVASIPEDPAFWHATALGDGGALFVDEVGVAFTDGTSAGTVPLVDDRYVRAGASTGSLAFLGRWWGLLRSDGTPAGTFNIGPTLFPFWIELVGDQLYFGGQNPDPDGPELWKTDGTEEGTIPLADPVPGGNGAPIYLTYTPAGIFFTASDDDHGRELWILDETETETRRLTDLRPGLPSASIYEVTAFGNRVLFRADDGVHGTELWVSDGTTAGTHMVRDIAPGAAGSVPEELTVFGDWLVFRANDGTSGSELWVSDGTRHGTIRLDDTVPGPAGSLPMHLTVANNQLFFSAQDADHDIELYRLDPLVDVDQDGVGTIDNCTTVANPAQTDADGDGIGNACDPDLNNDCVVNIADIAQLRAAFLSRPGDAQWNPAADFDADGIVNLRDLATMRGYFLAGPGPSATPCVP